MTPLEKLDAVLQSLQKHQKEEHHNLISIAKLLETEHPNIDFGEITSILNKLHKDGFIDTKEIKIEGTESTDMYYIINFEGRAFNEAKGYVRKNKINNSDRITLRVLNWTVAISGFIVAVYYLLELWKYFFTPQSCR